MYACRTSREKTGFTLIEVLVVMAIICLLASIMLPVFSSARTVSKKAVCQSNLRQLYIAFQLYAEDWENTFPCPGGLYGGLTYWAQEDGNGIDIYLKNQHLGIKSVFCCPSYTGVWNSEYPPRTYGMNSFLRTPPDVEYPASLIYLTGIRRDKIIAPSDTILLYEGIPANNYKNPLGEGYVYRCADWTWVRGSRGASIIHWQDADKPWHGDKNNYLMCDGHIMVMKPEKDGEFTRPTLGNNFWYARKLR